jgi:peroxiredoxin Q/BCP
MLKKGDSVADLEFEDSVGREYNLKDFSTHKAIALYFYPKDFTYICTAQACHFRDHYKEIRELGGVVFGVSLDSEDKHNAFAEKFKLPFSLIFDRDKLLSNKFGSLRLGGVLRNKRVTFIISPKGEIVEVVHHQYDANVHADRFIEILKTL